MAAIKARLFEADKQRKLALSAKAESSADALIAAGLGPVVVDVMAVGSSQKVAKSSLSFSTAYRCQAVLTAISKLKQSSPQSALLLFGIDEQDDEFVVLAQVPKVRQPVMQRATSQRRARR